MPPNTAARILAKVCYTSERFYAGDLYTFADARFPMLAGYGLVRTLYLGHYLWDWTLPGQTEVRP